MQSLHAQPAVRPIATVSLSLPVTDAHHHLWRVSKRVIPSLTSLELTLRRRAEGSGRKLRCVENWRRTRSTRLHLLHRLELVECEILEEGGASWVAVEDPEHLLAGIGEEFLGVPRIGDGLALLGITRQGW